MPSGITHMLLAQTFNEKSGHGNDSLEFLLDEKLKVFQVGALAPDIAYSQNARPWRNLLKSESGTADLLHYKQTNQVPLQALESIQQLAPSADKDNQFAFFLGYISHIVADGIVHPFVRDKVGNYEVASGEHRALEMRLDAIFLDSLMEGVNINYANLHDQIKDASKEELDSVLNLFSKLLEEVYQIKFGSHRIADWIDDLHDLFEIAENENNCFYASFPGMGTFLYNDTAEVLANKDADLWLRNNEAVGRKQNFLGQDVHFLDDCVPRFHRAFAKIAVSAYEWVYNAGPALSAEMIPAINLDTGRLFTADDSAGINLDHPAEFWRAKWQ